MNTAVEMVRLKLNKTNGTFDQFLRSNRAFWYPLFDWSGGADSGTALIEASLTDQYLLHGTMKVGLIFAKLHSLTPVICPSITQTQANRRLLHSMCRNMVWSRLFYLRQLVFKAMPVINLIRKVRSGADILEIRIDGAEVGKYVYDCMIGRYKSPTIREVTLRMKLYVAYWLFWFYTFQLIVRKYRVRLAIVPDPTYIGGLIFQICKTQNIRCIQAINLWTFQIHKYYHSGEYDKSWRQIDPKNLERLPDDGGWLRSLERYLERRINGNIKIHDVLLAYGSGKIIYSRDEIFEKFKFDRRLPLVVLMAHVFSDIAHAYPGMLFADYGEWVRESLRMLMRNKQVNFLVKEHPSTPLYGEEGLLLEVMGQVGCSDRLLPANTHTTTVLGSADYVITAGGTIGLEFAVKGKPVILAARPHYAGLGFTVEPKDDQEYGEILSERIQRLPKLSNRQVLNAKKASYVMFELFDNYSKDLELGGIRPILGEEYDREVFQKGMIEANAVPLERQRIYARVQAFHQSPDGSLLNWGKLSEHLRCDNLGNEVTGLDSALQV